MLRYQFFVGFVSMLLTATTGWAEDGCTKDTDCKGERICELRQCVDPSARSAVPPVNPASPVAVPASFQPVPASAARPATTEMGRPVAPVFQSTVNRHLGFYIRPDIGIGYMSASEDATNASITVSGVSGLGGLAIGGALTENLIFAAHVIDAVAVNPNVSATSGGQSASATAQNTTMTMWGVGPELTYYFMPQNIYFTGTFALTKMSLQVNNKTTDTDWGYGLRAALGKEWWVSDHWGLGLVGHVSYSINQDPSSTSNQSFTLSTWATGLAFSATYN
jgi:hypothetical protein